MHVIVSAVGLVLSTASASAQDMARPSSVRFAANEWTFVPVVKNTAGIWSSPGVLALRDKDNVVGENIVAIWYEFPAAAGGVWSATSWVSQDHWQAITHTKNRFAISSVYDFVWPTDDPIAAPVNPEAPEPYFHGLFTVDPLAGLPIDENRDQVISTLTELGYQSASVAVEQVGLCEGEMVLDALAATAVLAASTPTPTATLEAAFGAAIPASCAQIAAPAPLTGFVSGTEVPLPGIPLGPWKRDSRPAFPHGNCDLATQCCYAAPIIFIYKRKGLLGLEYIEYCEGLQVWNCPGEPGVPCPAVPTCPAPEATPDPSVPVTCGYSFN